MKVLLSEDFVQLDAQIHGIAYPDYDLITAQIQTRLRILQAWFPVKGSILILLYEEILATLEQVAAYRKDFNNHKIND